MYILGISAYYHDSAAALIKDGSIIAAAQEERFTRRKHDEGFPVNSVKYCLKEAGIGTGAIDHVVFYEKPLVKFERLLETYMSFAPRGLKSFSLAMPLWLGKKLHLPQEIKKELHWDGKVLFAEHHESHAASAFFPSPFKEAAVICFDGVGEWATTTWGTGIDNRVELKQQVPFPHSIGLLYSAFTYYLGFKVNSGEYKIMGLAPYGEARYFDVILDELMDLKPDGSFRLNMKYFNYCHGLTMTNSQFDNLFGSPPRTPETGLTKTNMDIAASIQKVTEEVMFRIGQHVHKETGMKNLCMAGGVALNCVGNSGLLRKGPYSNIWVQPAAGDAGGALGAALAIWHHKMKKPRESDNVTDKQSGSYLGPSYSKSEIRGFLDRGGYPYREFAGESLYDEVAGRLDAGEVIGWFQGRMEYGARALGARSILADARNPEMQQKLNLKIKFREAFRPFAPSVLLEQTAEWFEFSGESPYMLMVAPVAKEKRLPSTEEPRCSADAERINIPRSTIPAVTHLDYSARLQTVDGRFNERYFKLITAFYLRTGCPVVINTSFNMRGEPIVCSPEDAYTCFMRTGMDTLVMEDFILEKARQPCWKEKDDWQKNLELD
ncbi:MAG: carbamoyltransferase family protein [Thermodesulfovibrionales bacterium]